MQYNFVDLNETTRNLMLKEIELDLKRNTFFELRSMNDFGLAKYPQLLKECVQENGPNELAQKLPREFFLPTNRSGKRTMNNIHEVVAYNDFNKYYIRSLLVQSIQKGYHLEIYRAKYSKNPRFESSSLLRKRYSSVQQMADMLKLFREADILYTQVPRHELLKPNSGLSLRIIVIPNSMPPYQQI